MATPLKNKWTYYAFPDPKKEWILPNFVKVIDLTKIEDVVMIGKAMPDDVPRKNMLFVMREGIPPLWEHPTNNQGGYFSYKIAEAHVPSIWKNLLYGLTAEELTEDGMMMSHINGISISPKRNFCIIKIWFQTSQFQDARKIRILTNGIVPQGCLFSKYGSSSKSL
jgi:hypothetical protein